MTEYDLVELIHNHYCNGDIQDTIIELNELIEKIDLKKLRQNLIFNLSKEVENLSLTFNCCPLCGSNLESSRYLEPRGEYQGFLAHEEMYYLECSDTSCGYTTKN